MSLASTARRPPLRSLHRVRSLPFRARSNAGRKGNSVMGDHQERECIRAAPPSYVGRRGEWPGRWRRQRERERRRPRRHRRQEGRQNGDASSFHPSVSYPSCPLALFLELLRLGLIRVSGDGIAGAPFPRAAADRTCRPPRRSAGRRTAERNVSDPSVFPLVAHLSLRTVPW
jgi:hypothetical protein